MIPSGVGRKDYRRQRRKGILDGKAKGPADIREGLSFSQTNIQIHINTTTHKEVT